MPVWLPRRWPLLPTILVGLAIVAMIGLGSWQLRRAGQKEAFIAELRHNPDKPAIAYPELGPVVPESMFRRSSVNCLSVDSWNAEAGKAADGTTGFRYIAHCRTSGGEGPGALVALGVAARPDLTPEWQGGVVSGWITKEPDHRSLLSRAIGPKTVLRPMLIADGSPLPELKASALPNVDDVPNNHRAYAVQWFLFAVVAAVIYVLALARRQNRDGKPAS